MRVFSQTWRVWFHLAVYFSLVSLSVCSFDRGDRYWSGEPQPIGIDFSSVGVTAVYANGPKNFTLLGFAGDNSHYSTYLFSLFSQRYQFGHDFAFEKEDEAIYSYLWRSRIWFAAQGWIKDKVQELKSLASSKFCDSPWPVFDRYNWLYEFCEPKYEYIPQKPKSRYKSAAALRDAQKQLRFLMPKWFRNSDNLQPLTKTNFILTLVDLLEEIKRMSMKVYNTTITSAVISRPNWANNEIGDLFDEACLIANIEIWEQPHDRVEIVTKTLAPGLFNSVMVIERGHYFLNVFRQVWDVKHNEYQGVMSMGLHEYSSMSVMQTLSKIIIGLHNHNTSAEEQVLSTHLQVVPTLREVISARHQIKYGSQWPQNQSMEERTVRVNLTDDVTGSVKSINMTGLDVVTLDENYMQNLSERIEQFLWREVGISQYLQSHALEELSLLTRSEQIAIMRDIMKRQPPPGNLDSWTDPIDHVIILDVDYFEIELLSTAAERAISANAHDITLGEEEKERAEFKRHHDLIGNQCVHPLELVARGAATRALDWVGYWESEKTGDAEFDWDTYMHAYADDEL